MTRPHFKNKKCELQKPEVQERSAILRSSRLKALHDEEEEYAAQTAAARAAAKRSRLGIDTFAFVVSFKGVFLEGVEIVFIVITFGLSANNVSAAVWGAVVAGVLVLVAGAIAHKPLAMVPENTLKYGVGLLASFGAYWAILALLVGWFAVSRMMVRALPGVKEKQEVAA